ncbi:hypothetical protein HN803_05210 [candidate division WWE3 bacterium]|jgi:hypothetical protein|nr:hypothetical protein [candidate division WWE3 bacterium]
MLKIEQLINNNTPAVDPRRQYKDANIEDIVSEDALKELLDALVGKQRQINTEKALRKAYEKTNEQVKRYLTNLFVDKPDDEVRRVGAFLMLYVQKFKKGATFLGFQRFLKSNRFRKTEDITNEYIGLITKDEMSNIYDILEEFNGPLATN